MALVNKVNEATEKELDVIVTNSAGTLRAVEIILKFHNVHLMTSFP